MKRIWCLVSSPPMFPVVLLLENYKPTQSPANKSISPDFNLVKPVLRRESQIKCTGKRIQNRIGTWIRLEIASSFSSTFLRFPKCDCVWDEELSRRTIICNAPNQYNLWFNANIAYNLFQINLILMDKSGHPHAIHIGTCISIQVSKYLVRSKISIYIQQTSRSFIGQTSVY